MKRTKIILLCGICIGFFIGTLTGARLHYTRTEAAAAEPTFFIEETTPPQERILVSESAAAESEAPASASLPATTDAPESSEVPLPVTTVHEAEERIVYITPTGKRYHYSEKCAGKNAVKIELSEAEKIKTPCQKCVK